ISTISPDITSLRPCTRTMPSDTLVIVPSLRASAVSLNSSMRCLMSSLISDGLIVVAILVSRFVYGLCRTRMFQYWVVRWGVSRQGGGRDALAAHCRVPMRSLDKRLFESRQAAAHRTIYDNL